jgi:drug/metabolite transporter (DMT)-like permease
MSRAILFAAIAAIGNAVFVLGQRGSEPSKNPFLFSCGAVTVCAAIFVAATWIAHTGGDTAYLTRNYTKILISGLGFFITFFGFYLLYSRFGASQYIIYAVLSILTTTIGVGVLYFKEPFNIFHISAIIMAVLSIALYSYGQRVG